MKYNRFLMAVALMVVAIGCSVKESLDTADEPFQIVFEASPFLDGDAGEDTKTYVTPNGNYSAYSFYWSAQDMVGIFPSEGNQIAFSMANGAGASSATFDGGAWTCKVGYTYRSYFPFIGDYVLDPTRIPVSFIGQKQVGNGNSDHFQKYDYMYAPATTKEGSFLSFSYKHLIAAVLPYVELPAGHYTELTLSLDEPLFVTEGYYDLTAATPAIVGTKFSKKIYLDLDVTFADTETLVAYVPIAPMNMTGKKLTISITDETGFVYRYTYTPGKPYAASNIYRLRSANSLVNYASQNISFEDDNFKAYLVAHYDTNGDGEITHEEARNIIDIQISNDMAIHSLQGIEYMPYLYWLQCPNLGLVSLDLTNNKYLRYLFCYNNQLTSLDLSNNTVLRHLDCSNNQLTSLDVSNNTLLLVLSCSNNQLTSLDVSNNTALECLYCSSNQLTSLDISNNTALTGLSCGDNQFTSLNVSNSKALERLYCVNSTKLTDLCCRKTRLLYLDVTGCTALVNLSCEDNKLKTLDISSNLALHSINCSTNFLTSLDVSNNTALTSLDCGDNQLISLEVSNNTALTSLSCSNNQLISLDMSNNTALTSLSCSNNQLISLDMSNNTALTSLSCSNNQLTTLDVSNNSALWLLCCDGNKLTSLDVSSHYSLLALIVYNNPALTSLKCNNCSTLGGLSFSGCTALTSLEYAFLGCTSLTSITIPESVTDISGAFWGCTGLTSITIPESVTDISGAFSGCTSLNSITIPESVTDIGSETFLGCTGLTSITIPESVTGIGSSAFYGCTGLTSIVVNAFSVPSGGENMFSNTNNCPIFVPAASLNDYKTAQSWSDYAYRIQAIPE